jgi:PAS domain S-box-containing protein
MKSGFFEKLVERLDRMDPGSVQSQFIRLARERGLMETIFQAIQEGIIVVDGAGCISYANKAAEKLLGFSQSSAEGSPIAKYVRDIEWERVLKLDDDEWSRMVSREIETTYPEHRFLDFYVVPLSVVNEEEDGAVLILRDITRERETEAKTIESERLKAITLLAAGVAHEIGNPLNSLNIHLQLLERELRELPEERREAMGEMVEVAKHEVARLDQIITQFLKALRPVPPQFEVADLGALLRDSLKVLQPEIDDRKVLIEIEQAEELPAVQVDPGQMKQAFFNIIKNAVQAMMGGGLLKIEIGSTDKYVTLTFQDSGEGISAEHLGQVFEPYHTTKSEGTGLGLMIVQRVIRDHGGEIEIYTERGRGTTITLFLPREDQRTRLLKAHRPGQTNAGETA